LIYALEDVSRDSYSIPADISLVLRTFANDLPYDLTDLAVLTSWCYH